MNANLSAKNNIGDWLADSTAKLASAGIASARLDCLLLLEMVLNTNRTQLLASPEKILSREHFSVLNQLLSRRLKHEPIAYIRGQSEFFGRTFLVNKNVLVPRPESEIMIEMLLNLPLRPLRTIIDVGTGSGALAITTVCELGEAQVIATDISQACLDIARQNADLHQATVDFKLTNLVKGLQTAGCTILANLPYVPNEYPINNAAQFEPKLALLGGKDGLDLYRELFSQLADQGPDYILTESLPPQHQSLEAIAKQNGFKLLEMQGYISLFSL